LAKNEKFLIKLEKVFEKKVLKVGNKG